MPYRIITEDVDGEEVVVEWSKSSDNKSTSHHRTVSEIPAGMKKSKNPQSWRYSEGKKGTGRVNRR